MPELEDISGLLLRAAGWPHAREQVVRELTGPAFAGRRRLVDSAADLVLAEVVGRLLRRGWQPYDVHRITARRADARTAGLAGDALAAEVDGRPAATVHPRWWAQLEQIGAVVWWQRGEPRLSQYARREGCGSFEALSCAVRALGVLATLPALPELPLSSPSQAGVDGRMLARVRALLAKAESTQFPEEAEALSAKAQELMSRYSFEQALVSSPRSAGSARRFWLDEPYLAAKSALVSAVASANRCRAVSYQRLGFLSVVGHEVDLDFVELLATSLLVQATEAMLAAGRHGSRTRSFRHAFLLAYAGRIGERLEEANSAASAEVSDERLRPVLARRSQEVDALFAELFPRVSRRSHSVSNGAGWQAGRAAAETAKLTVERSRLSS
ncbi:DUF2786 domain-containing protein [Amycolatopsis alkalitolerans]|uniref:DUF2786 domain-containing protein n=1 Tax=Amycolatopsis alkalitolerans TaxID=2547244 RepID=A0A5C4M3N4_9PSEU|nr:DUF2786 domain-containing protein [Amycolatopsis alkalitolerans]TNC27665.1 DUF2786 domain-containing protein [Amycolatopsis alkalitolerans]